MWQDRRFFGFAGVCAVWAAALVVWPSLTAIQAAGHAWFICWSVQIVISVASWICPLVLPAPYYETIRVRSSGKITRVPGLALFGRIAGWVNPLSGGPRGFTRLDGAMIAAETTHAITFAVVSFVALVFVARGIYGLAAWLLAYNALFNLYAVLLQRRNRARLRRIEATRHRPNPFGTTTEPSVDAVRGPVQLFPDLAKEHLR